jgi:hypothetical protein
MGRGCIRGRRGRRRGAVGVGGGGRGSILGGGIGNCERSEHLNVVRI